MHARQAASDRSTSRDPDGRHTRIGYVLRRGGHERHHGIVSQICLFKGGRRGEATSVLTASRDGTLKCWDVPVNETHGGASSSTAPAPSSGGSSLAPTPHGTTPQLRCSLEEHSAWVNDAVVLPYSGSSADASRDSRRIVSASNDMLLKVWQVDEEKQGSGVSGALLSLRYHIDYVTCLAYAPHRSLLASAGLDSRSVVSDLEAATRVLTFGNGEEEPYSRSRERSSSGGHRGAQPANVPQRCIVGQFTGTGQYIPQLLATLNRDPATGYEHGRGQSIEENGGDGAGGAGGGGIGSSVWSLATTRSASLLVTGTASCVVRGWDPRSGAKLWRMRGHTENVRALALSDDGTICISGSADRTVRVWDVGMRRCIHVFEAHHDSVWALATAGHSCGYPSGSDTAGAGGAFGEVFSGGRDGLVLSFDLRLMQTRLVAREPSALQALAVPTDGGEVWCSAADSHVRRHSVPNTPVLYGLPQLPRAAAPAPVAADESIAIRGTPRLTDYKVLHNKRQVLVKDACDNLSLWDVTNGQCIDLPTPAVQPGHAVGGQGGVGTGAGSSTAAPGKAGEEAMKRALAQVNKTVSVPNWFTCDLTLGSLSVYLDVSQCFKAEGEDADIVVPSAVAAGARGAGGNTKGSIRGAESQASTAPVNMGAKTLRALFETWVRLPALVGGNHGGRGVAAADGSRSGSAERSRRPALGGYPFRVFYAPPSAQEQGSGGASAQGVHSRWDADQPPGTPADQASLAEPVAGGNSSPASFHPSTPLLFVGRSGSRSSGFRGRLYCGLFNGIESPEMLPSWVVDVVWNQRPPPEELCGERTMLFSLVRCSSELALPALPTPYCMAAPGMRIRRLMGYLVRTLEFDWSAPTKGGARRQSGAVSLASRLGRCCVVPSAGRGRAASSDSWGSQSDGCEVMGGNGGVSTGATPASSGAGGGSSRRSRSSGRERSSHGGGHSASGGASSSSRRSFGLRRNEDEARNGADGVVGRVRIDGSPSPLPSVQAQAPGARRGGNSSGEVGGNGGVGRDAVAPDERHVEILCNDVSLDPEMSLATVRDFIWKRHNVELVLHFRRAARTASNPTSPPPPPPLLPGSQSSSKDVTKDMTVGVSSGTLGNDSAGSADGHGGEDATSELKLNGSDGMWRSGPVDSPSGRQEDASPFDGAVAKEPTGTN